MITTDGAPAAIGPYAQGVRAGNLIFTAGQGGLDPVTGRLFPAASRNRQRELSKISKPFLKPAEAAWAKWSRRPSS